MLNKPVKISTGGTFTLIPEGVYQVQLADINLLENVITSYAPEGKDMLDFKFVILDDVEIPAENGKEATTTRGKFLSQRMTPSLNEKATMYALVKAIMGRLLTKDEIMSFNPESLIGKQCQIVVVQNPSKDGTKMFANIDNYLKATKKLPPFDGDLQQTVVLDNVTKPLEIPKTDAQVKEELGKI